MQETINKNHEFLMNKADEFELNEYRKIGSLEDCQQAVKIMKGVQKADVSIKKDKIFINKRCSAGILCAHIVDDKENPTICIQLRRHDGKFITLAEVCGDLPSNLTYGGGFEINVYRNADAFSDDFPSDSFLVFEEQITLAEPPC